MKHGTAGKDKGRLRCFFPLLIFCNALSSCFRPAVSAPTPGKVEKASLMDAQRRLKEFIKKTQAGYISVGWC